MSDLQKEGTLDLGGVIFQMEQGTESKFYVFESDEDEDTITVSLDILFQDGEYEEETVSPSICINEHETGVSDITEVVGRTFTVDNIEDADEREDTFYLFEHEPMEEYQFTILEVADGKVHVQVNGTAVTDGYANPYKTEKFSVDCWLPINR